MAQDQPHSGFLVPAYTHIPRITPHPLRDPQGHSFGQVHADFPTPDWRSLPDCDLFQQGRQLFNAGYYWEAHEAWEGVWIAAGRAGLVADFLKGLIKMAAAGVKLREGSSVGAHRHLARAEELLILTRSRQPADVERLDPLLELVVRLRRALPQSPKPDFGIPIHLFGQI